ncbi:uncharacterized protein AB9X84_014428 isoform 2-T2 [Acanthopagrus schlegelii]
MSSTILLIILSAHITGLISEQLLRAAVGGSVLIPCSLPGYPLSLNWIYWQEGNNLVFRWENGEEIKIEDNKYKGRFQVFTHEFSAGNISIRLDNISPEDDQKTFFAYVKFDKERQSEERCRSKLQVSAPYQDLNLTVNHTTNSATCSARGGYPAAQVSWKGLNRYSDEELDLQDAETFLQPDPTEKTFSFTSSVNVTGLKSVTCVVYNPHSNKTSTRTEKIDTGENDKFNVAATVVVLIIPVILIILAGVYWYRRQHQPQAQDHNQPQAQDQDQAQPQDQDQAQAQDHDQAQPQDQDQAQAQDHDQAQDQALVQDPDPPNQPLVVLNPQDGAQEEAQDQDQDQDPANQPLVKHNTQHGAQAEVYEEHCHEDEDASEPAQDPVQEAEAPDETVSLTGTQAAFHRRTRTSEGTADRDNREDAAASPEKEKLLEKENGNEDCTSD